MSVNTGIRVPKIAELIAEQIQDDIAAARGDAPGATRIWRSHQAS